MSDVQAPETLGTEYVHTQRNQEEEVSKQILGLCKSIYEQSYQDRTLGSLKTVEDMMIQLGAAGYAVIDQSNQFNMENPELVREFCNHVEMKQEAELLVIMVLNNGGFVQFNFAAKQGEVEVTARSLVWKENTLVNIDIDRYPAHTWNFSEQGYLFFNKYYMPGLAGPYNHVAMRVEPLDDKYRKLNRQYILPIGYHANNLFIIDWNTTDYGGLDFYDLFAIIYQIESPESLPYSSDHKGDILQIPKAEFEAAIMKYFTINSRLLQEKTKYLDVGETYEYRPRGMYDSSAGTEIPYPEVIDCENKDDGTIELTVQAVWPEQNLETAFIHKVVVRPLPDEGFQYVCNQVISTENQMEPSWYVNRLTEEEWKD